MSLIIVGTVPYEGFPLIHGVCSGDHHHLRVGLETIPVLRGTPALLAAACAVTRVLGLESPQTILAGDIGKGDGSKQIYAYLCEYLKDHGSEIMVFHYLQPEIDWHNRILMQIDDLVQRPLLIADAGYMYVAKMSGFASSYDLFTPDVGELAFLADESAPHPFYTRGFLLQEEHKVPEQIQRAYLHENAARYLLVKGRKDVVASSEGIIRVISEPCEENLEPIGGTGDSLTGIVAALVQSGKTIVESAILGAAINRYLGLLAKPTPASSIAELLSHLPQALHIVLSQRQNEFL